MKASGGAILLLSAKDTFSTPDWMILLPAPHTTSQSAPDTTSQTGFSKKTNRATGGRPVGRSELSGVLQSAAPRTFQFAPFVGTRPNPIVS